MFYQFSSLQQKCVSEPYYAFKLEREITELLCLTEILSGRLLLRAFLVYFLI